MQRLQQNATLRGGKHNIMGLLGLEGFCKVLIVSLFVMFPVLVMAQASGGQITRKKGVTNSQVTNSTNKSATSSKQSEKAKESKSTKGSPSNKKETEVINLNHANIETSTHKWNLALIILSPNKTVLRKYVTPKGNNTSIYSTKDEYIEDVTTGVKYYILKSSIGFERKKVEGTGTQYFDEEYPPLPIDTKYVSISSGYSYFVRNLKIR